MSERIGFISLSNSYCMLPKSCVVLLRKMDEAPLDEEQSCPSPIPAIIQDVSSDVPTASSTPRKPRKIKSRKARVVRPKQRGTYKPKKLETVPGDEGEQRWCSTDESLDSSSMSSALESQDEDESHVIEVGEHIASSQV